MDDRRKRFALGRQPPQQDFPIVFVLASPSGRRQRVMVNAAVAGTRGFDYAGRISEIVIFQLGWVEPLRNPSHVAIATMGFASLNPSYELLLEHRLGIVPSPVPAPLA